MWLYNGWGLVVKEDVGTELAVNHGGSFFVFTKLSFEKE